MREVSTSSNSCLVVDLMSRAAEHGRDVYKGELRQRVRGANIGLQVYRHSLSFT